MNARLLVYGANGYTGELIARAAAAQGMSPVLAGRSAGPIVALAQELGCEPRVFGLDDPAAVAAGLSGCSVVVHCAGPFSATAAPMMAACLAARVHYTDITGEIDVFELGFGHDEAARRSGIVICPGVGFDVVPTDCIALTLKEALPDATSLALGFDSKGALSRGTASTSVEGLGNGSRVREDGKLVRIPLGSRSRRIDFGTGLKLATAIPWGDVSTAYRTTGIPDIEVYVPVSPRALANLRRLGRLGWLLRRRSVQALLKWRIRKGAPGPTAEQRGRSPVLVWGQAKNATGRTVTARVRVPNGYTVTTDAAVAIAGRLLEPGAPPGFTTPARLMGAGFVSTLPGAGPITLE
ncbi:MAG TPA: saccharopine dehydrogenase NADP-binding domain-containing protein [Steroidobacteraceae bacterium]|nr:saccharopine dehydrogenase NADP-binding domain-containing protein [Steroidobacteraceae bacterium]